MKNRKPANSVGQKKRFSATAAKTHSKNLRGNPMRGGFRL